MTNKKTENRFPDERIVDIALTQELSDSFLEYSYYVIYAIRDEIPIE